MLKAPSTGRTYTSATAGRMGKPAAIMCLAKAAETEGRRGVEAWRQLQTHLRHLCALNKERALEAARVKNRRSFATGVRQAFLSGLVDRPVIALPTSVGYGGFLRGHQALTANTRARRRILGRRDRQMNGMDMGVATQLGSFASFVALVGADDGGDDAAGRGPGSLETRSCQRSCVRRAAIRRVVPRRLDTRRRVAVYTLYRPHGSFAAGAIAIAAGVYEFTPLKQVFRRRCCENVRS
jgi:hypothetical protein